MLHLKLATASEISIELGARIKTARHAKSMLQSELAARAGISRKTLMALELHGQTSLVNFIRVVTALGQSEQLHSMLLSQPSSIAELAKQAQQVTSPQRVRLKSRPLLKVST